MRTFYTLALVFLPVAAYAQNYEFGLHGGTSLYNSKSVSNARGSADVGLKTGWVGGFTLGHNMYDKLGGEIRYTYLRNDLKVSSGSTDVKFGGEAHAIHYDFLIHTASRESKVRPYVAFGGGVKQFRGTGTEAAFQPLSQFAILTKTSEVAGMLSVGGGIKIAVSDRILFRVDVHDYLTPFPKDVITPGPGTGLSGWLNNIVPTAGIAFRF